MKRFQFRLERVLQWQEQQRQIQESRLKALLHEVEKTKAAIAEVQATRSAIEQQVLASPTINPGDLVALSEYRQRSAREEGALRRTGQEYQQRAAQQRTLWQAAERKCRMLDRLKEKQLREHQFEEDREMETFASEMFLSRWKPARRSHEEEGLTKNEAESGR